MATLVTSQLQDSISDKAKILSLQNSGKAICLRNNGKATSLRNSDKAISQNRDRVISSKNGGKAVSLQSSGKTITQNKASSLQNNVKITTPRHSGKAISLQNSSKVMSLQDSGKVTSLQDSGKVKSLQDSGASDYGDFVGVREEFELEESTEGPERHSNGLYYPICIGDVLIQKYRIEHKLGHGNYSTVWLAHDILKEKDVALRSWFLETRDKMNTTCRRKSSVPCRTLPIFSHV
jgi:hypothetical protein